MRRMYFLVFDDHDDAERAVYTGNILAVAHAEDSPGLSGLEQAIAKFMRVPVIAEKISMFCPFQVSREEGVPPVCPASDYWMPEQAVLAYLGGQVPENLKCACELAKLANGSDLQSQFARKLYWEGCKQGKVGDYIHGDAEAEYTAYQVVEIDRESGMLLVHGRCVTKPIILL